MTVDPTRAEIERLRDENYTLKAKLHTLLDDRNSAVKRLMDARIPGMTWWHAQMLYAMWHGQTMTRESLSVWCNHKEDADLRLVDCQIKRVRRALPHIKIRSVYGVGYALEPESVAWLRDIIAADTAASSQQSDKISNVGSPPRHVADRPASHPTTAPATNLNRSATP